MIVKKRLDDILVEKNIFENKNKAKTNIILGNVIVNNEKIIKPGSMFDFNNVKINIINQKLIKFVSRSGVKLEKAITKYNINVNDLVCLDIGASTGGFTDCLLQKNAKKVYALDVGTNQLDYQLRINDKVIVMEKFNFRNAKKSDFSDKIDFFCCDVSFISLKLIIGPLKEIIDNNVWGVLLIKPQFEADRINNDKGKINSKEGHIQAIENVYIYLKNANFEINELDFSPILGNKKKNLEFLVIVTKKEIVQNKSINTLEIKKIKEVVDIAHNFFKENEYEEY